MSEAANPTAPILLVGCGKMGSALIAGWRERHVAPRFVVVEPAGAPNLATDANVELHRGPETLSAELDPAAIVLAVKPQALDAVLPPYRDFARRGTLFLSIAAGKTLGYFARQLGAEAAVVRAMPNTPAAIGRGIAVAVPSARVDFAARTLADRLLAAVGEVHWVDQEALLDAVTAVSGSGPAYVFLLIECLEEAGVAAGLPAPLAARLALATVAGAGELARRSADAPATLRVNVTSPGGTTEAALAVLMGKNGLAPLIARAVAAATRRSRALAD